MTLSFRNRLIILANIIFFTLGIFVASLFLYSYHNNLIKLPNVEIKNTFFLFEYKFLAVVWSVFVFMVCVIITSLNIYRHFLKTRSPEILFFGLFLLGCFSEVARLLIPLNDFFPNYSLIMMYIAKSVFFGRIICPLSFLFIALMSNNEQRLHEERNMIIIIMTALFFCYIVPFNFTKVTSFLTIQWGYAKFLTVFRILVFALDAFSMHLSNLQKDIEQTKQITIGYLLLIVGYFILCNTYNYFLLSLGSISFILGIQFYLINIHKKYLW